jgi:hypothetical protein
MQVGQFCHCSDAWNSTNELVSTKIEEGELIKVGDFCSDRAIESVVS